MGDAPAGAVAVKIKELPGGTVELIDGIPDQPNNVTDLKPGGRAFFRITANTEAGYSVSTSGQGKACLNWSSDGGETWQRGSWGYNGYGRIDLPADCSEILVKGGFERSAVTVSVAEVASGGIVEVRGLYDQEWSGGPLTVRTWAGAFYAKAEPAEGYELKSLAYTQSDGSLVPGEDMSSQGEEYSNVWMFPIPEEYLDGTVTAEFKLIGAADGTIVQEVETGEGDVATITAGGTYHLVKGASGTVKVATTDAVTLVGNGAKWGEDYKITSEANDVLVDCASQPGVNVTLKDVYFNNRDRGAVDVTGSGNTLNFEGTSIIDYQPQLSYGYQPAAIHVGVGSSLTVGGTGALYLYKYSSGAGIGGGTAEDSSEMNGSITLSIAQLFAKGSKQGALIGSGEGAKGTGAPGSITFASGEYNLLSVSRGAVVGGAAGGTAVTIKPQANVNINIDFSGSAIGGGYDGGNDSDGGTLYMAGGSLRT